MSNESSGAPTTGPWYFSFGSGHQHHDGYVKIEGTFSEARNEMFRRYGAKWCMQYTEEEFLPQITRWNLKEVK